MSQVPTSSDSDVPTPATQPSDGQVPTYDAPAPATHASDGQVSVSDVPGPAGTQPNDVHVPASDVPRPVGTQQSDGQPANEAHDGYVNEAKLVQGRFVKSQRSFHNYHTGIFCHCLNV